MKLKDMSATQILERTKNNLQAEIEKAKIDALNATTMWQVKRCKDTVDSLEIQLELVYDLLSDIELEGGE